MKILIFILIFVLVALNCTGDKPDNIVVSNNNGVYTWYQLSNTPSILEYTSPVYPEALRRASITGTTLIEVIIEKTGQVDSVKVVKSSGNAIFDSISRESAKTLVFEVPKVGDDSVRATVIIPFKYELVQ